MLTENIPWILAVASFVLLLGTMLMYSLENKKPREDPLPSQWSLAPRPIFNADERHVYRLLRDALPGHIVLTKLPLVRLCQPADRHQQRYWYELLGAVNVGFAICSPSGRVLAAIDIDGRHGRPRRSLHIKRKVLAACRVRYLRCPADRVPSAAELQLLVSHKPLGDAAAEAPTSALADSVLPDVQKKSVWHDSGFGTAMRGVSVREQPTTDDEVGGVVVGWTAPQPTSH